MTDARGTQTDLGPPLSEAEAELIWYAPASGLSTALLMVLFLDLGIVMVLIASQMLLLAVAVLVALGLLVIFSLLSAAHLLGPGGITVQRPFGTESHPWSDFASWRRSGELIILHYAEHPKAQPLRIHTRTDGDKVVKCMSKYLPPTPDQDTPAGDGQPDG